MAFPTRALDTNDELSSLQQMMPGSTVVVLTVDAARGLLIPVQAIGPAAGRMRDLTIDVGYHVSGWVAANWVPMVNADAQLDLDVHANELRYALSMPLISDHRLTGVLTMYSVEPFGDAVLQQLDLLMPELAAALNHSCEVAAPSLTRDLRLVWRR
jgi:GAF domain-containing protein